MIPAISTILNQDITFTVQPSYTFYLDMDKNIVYGYTDGLQAVRQAIYLILHTERYRHVIFSWNYGVELESLFGQPISFILPEIQRRIKEALLQDDRIQAVNNFDFEVGRGIVTVHFTAQTLFGDIPIETVVATDV